MKKVKRGQIYYADLSPVVGSEQDGFRPVLILQNDTGNKYSPTTIVAPITSTKPDSRMPTHVRVNVEGLVSGSVALLEQIRTIDKRRLDDYVGKLNKDMMGKVDHAIIGSEERLHLSSQTRNTRATPFSTRLTSETACPRRS